MPLDSKASLLMYPSCMSNELLAKSVASVECTDDTDEEDNQLRIKADASLLDLVHTALQIRKDLLDTPGHQSGWQGIDKHHVEQIIHNSLYLFLSVLLGGTSVLETGRR